MTFGRVLLATVLLGTAVVLQTVVLSRLPLPGATPDLVLLVVVGLALVQGPVSGLLTGFAGGLLLDLVPPADGAVGRWALVLCLAGLVAGRYADAVERSTILPLVVVAGLAAGSLLLYAGLGWLLGDPRVTLAAVARTLPTAVLYDVLLTPFVVPAVMALARRVEPEPAWHRLPR
ncbi:MAG: rod shape-determining protein MreD [Actinomycetia bacterium]|nr:rod shape-determining protein MreD [Actinomycetes bacterium]